MTIPVDCDNLYSVITKASTNKAIQNFVKNTVDKSKWNSKIFKHPTGRQEKENR